MRYITGVLAAAILMIGVASASDTGFGDWGTASYDAVLGSHTASYSVGYSAMSSCSMGYDSASTTSNDWSWSPANDYSYGPVQYGDDDWDWYTL